MKFETRACCRCGGSGNYSYCPGYGTTCFRCKGSGEEHTRRGQRDYDAWRAAVDAAVDRPVESLKVGDFAKVDRFFPKYYRVVAVEVGDVYRITFSREVVIPSPCGMIRQTTWEVPAGGIVRIHAGEFMPKPEEFDSRVTPCAAS